jgi:hypothetical protein
MEKECRFVRAYRYCRKSNSEGLPTTKQTLLGVDMQHRWPHAGRKEDLVRGGVKVPGQNESGMGLQPCCMAGTICNGTCDQHHFVTATKLQSKKAVLAGSRPDP